MYMKYLSPDQRENVCNIWAYEYLDYVCFVYIAKAQFLFFIEEIIKRQIQKKSYLLKPLLEHTDVQSESSENLPYDKSTH